MRTFIYTTMPLVLCVYSSFGQTQFHNDGAPEAPAPLPSSPSPNSDTHLPRFGLAVGVSTLGATIQAATGVTRTENLRFGFSDFQYSSTFNKDGISYGGTLKLRSAEVLFDQYFGNIFHLSPGVMIYDDNGGNATANVPGNKSFSLGGNTYFSDPGNPVTGTGQISSRKVAPEFMIGFGNLLPRKHKHFTANFELGVVLQGSPNAKLQLNGGTCASAGGQCLAISSNPAVQANVLSEQTKVNNDLAPFKYYPVIRLTFGYKF